MKSQLSFYNKIAELISTANDAEAISSALYEIIDSYIDVPQSALFLLDSKEAKLKLYGNTGFTAEEIIEVEETAIKEHPGWVFKNQKALHIPDVDKEGAPFFVTSSKSSFKVKSRLWIPISTSDRSLGAFGFASPEADCFTDDHVNVLNFACRLAGNVYSSIIVSESEKEHLNNTVVSYRKIKEANKSQQDFIAKMSHEMRTPLNGIIGMSKLMEGTLLNQTQKKYIDIIDNQSVQLLGLINDVLDISKVQSPNFKLVNSSFNLGDLLTSSIKSYEVQAKEKGVDFQFVLEPTIHKHLRGDSLRLSQILNNLLSNALKFTKEGFVRITVSDTKQTKKFQLLEIIIEDTGIGIEESKRKDIFKGFLQENDSIIGDFGGTGLGLMITKEIIDHMKGEIKIESTKGVGSKFTTKLKISKSDINVSQKEPNDKVLISGLKILIAEDNDVNSFYLKTILERDGAIVTLALNGKEVVDQCKIKEFDLILMDIQMPIIDGVSATRILKEELNITTPVIAQTANTVQKDIDACYEVGMIDYISKPFSSNELKRKIDLNLNKSPHESIKARDNSFNESVLQLVNGNKEFAKKIINVFKQDTPLNITALKKAFSNKDEIQINKIGHKVKSSFRMLKMKKPLERSLWIEKFSRQNHTWDELQSQITLLEKECTQYLDESLTNSI